MVLKIWKVNEVDWTTNDRFWDTQRDPNLIKKVQNRFKEFQLLKI